MTFDTMPVFKPNQALTADHLNDLREFLDRQDRLTRHTLIGIGVMCGFRLDVRADANVLISAGAAVTSDGHLIAEDAVVCDRVVPYAMPLPSGDDVSPGQVAEARYPFLFPDGETQIEAWELLTTETTVPAGETEPEDLTSAFLADKTVMLFLEMTEEALKNCSINDCADKGAEIQYVLRRLLINRTDANAIMTREAEIAGFPTDRANHPSLALKYLRIEDLGLARNGIGTYPALFGRILQIAARLSGELPQVLRDAYAAYRYLLEDMYPAARFPDGPFPDDYFGNVWGNLAAQPFLAQYFYDYMLDAALAYNAFVDQARAHDCECLPHRGRFPRHVLLGDPVAAPTGFVTEVSSPAEFAAYDPLTASTGLGQGPRPPRRHTPWTPACAGPLRDDLRALFHRLTLLAHAFQLRGLLQEEIGITPSRHDQAPLGDRCIPPYYAFTVQSDLFRVWSPEKARANLLATVYSHQFSTRNAEHPYLYRVDGEDFHAVAGHVGKNLDRVLRELIVHKRVLGLDFGIEPVWMGLALADDREGQLVDSAASQRALEAIRRLILCRMGDFEVVLLTLLAALFAFLVFIIRALSRQAATNFTTPVRITMAAREAAGTAPPGGRELAALDIERLAAMARIDTLRRPETTAFTALRLDPVERRENRELSTRLLEQFRTATPEKGTATQALAGDAGTTSIAGIYLAVKDDADGGSLFERTRDRLARLRIGADNPEAAERVFNAVALLDAAETLLAKASVRSLAEFDAAGTEAAYVNFADRLEIYARTAPVDPQVVDSAAAAGNMAIADYAPAVAAQTPAFSSAGLLGEAQRRIQAIFQDLTLRGYARRHPGLEHRAGVPKGGTLVLAYVAKADLEALMRRAGPRIDSLADSLALNRVQGAFTTGLATAAAQLLRAAGPRNDDPLSDFVVVADFCLPSKCCDSDCSDIVLAGGLPDDLFDLDQPGRMAVDPIIPNGTPRVGGPGGLSGTRDAVRRLLGSLGMRTGRVGGEPVLTSREQPVEPASPIQPEPPSRPVAPTPGERTAERGTGTVAGRVTGAGSASNTPVRGAAVFVTDRATGRSTRVGTRIGEFRTRLPAGTYTFTAEAEGFERATARVTLEAGEVQEITLRLRRAR